MKGIHTVQLHRYFISALDLVLDQELPDEACPHVVAAEAARMAGLDSDQLGEIDSD